MSRPSDGAVWASVAETLRKVVVPALDEGTHAHAAAVQLVALAEHARDRAADPTLERDAELAAALDRLAGNALVPPDGSPNDRAAAALAAAVGRAGADADAVRHALRPLLVAHLDDDLAATAGLGEAFRGRLPGG